MLLSFGIYNSSPAETVILMLKPTLIVLALAACGFPLQVQQLIAIRLRPYREDLSDVLFKLIKRETTSPAMFKLDADKGIVVKMKPLYSLHLGCLNVQEPA